MSPGYSSCTNGVYESDEKYKQLCVRGGRRGDNNRTRVSNESLARSHVAAIFLGGAAVVYCSRCVYIYYMHELKWK